MTTGIPPVGQNSSTATEVVPGEKVASARHLLHHTSLRPMMQENFSHWITTGFASISETNQRQKHIPKFSERNHAGTSCGKPFRTGGNCIHVRLQQNILASSYKRPTSDFAFSVADDERFGQSQIPLPSGPPIKSANDLCFKLSSKRCLNCNLYDIIATTRTFLPFVTLHC